MWQIIAHWNRNIGSIKEEDNEWSRLYFGKKSYSWDALGVSREGFYKESKCVLTYSAPEDAADALFSYLKNTVLRKYHWFRPRWKGRYEAEIRNVTYEVVPCG